MSLELEDIKRRLWGVDLDLLRETVVGLRREEPRLTVAVNELGKGISVFGAIERTGSEDGLVLEAPAMHITNRPVGDYYFVLDATGEHVSFRVGRGADDQYGIGIAFLAP